MHTHCHIGKSSSGISRDKERQHKYTQDEEGYREPLSRALRCSREGPWSILAAIPAVVLFRTTVAVSLPEVSIRPRRELDVGVMPMLT